MIRILKNNGNLFCPSFYMQNSGNTHPMSLKISCSDWLHWDVVWNLHFSIFRGWPVTLNFPAFDFHTFPNFIRSLNFIHKLYEGGASHIWNSLSSFKTLPLLLRPKSRVSHVTLLSLHYSYDALRGQVS